MFFLVSTKFISLILKVQSNKKVLVFVTIHKCLIRRNLIIFLTRKSLKRPTFIILNVINYFEVSFLETISFGVIS